MSKEKINNPEVYIDYDNMTDFLNDYVICVKLDVYYRGTLQSEEALLPNAVKNRRKLKILEGYLEEVLSNQNSRLVDIVFRFIDFKSKVFVILDKVPIAFNFLNLVKIQANEEKKNLEVPFHAKEEFVEENIKTNKGIKYSDSHKTESHPKQNLRDYKEKEKHNKNQIYNDESQSIKQGSSNIAVDVNVIDGIKLIDDNDITNRIKNTVEEKLTITMEKLSPIFKSSKLHKELQNDIPEFLKSYILKLNNFANNHKGDKMASEVIVRGKRDELLESVKPSNKTTKPSPEENNSIKSKVSNQDMQIFLRYLNSKIIAYELKRNFLEKLFKFYKNFELIFSFPYYYTLSEEIKDEIDKTTEKHIHDINKIMADLLYVNDVENMIKDAIRSIFLVQTTTKVSPIESTGDNQKIQNVSSFALSKTSDKSTLYDTSELDSETGKKL